jgi:cyclase
LKEVLTIGKANAALAASIFHYNEHGIQDTKKFLASAGVRVRLI